jgi:Tfp pilus assembly PilM family ATPase
MHTSTFFKLFPPPKFMLMRHAGLEISDDAIHCLEYQLHPRGLRIGKFASMEVPDKVIEGGDIKDEKTLASLLLKLDKENGLSYVKVSVPEEKAYLFQTDVPPGDMPTIAQNIEFKIEENVPLSAQDAIFYFDIMPKSVTGGALRASVSVVARAHVEHMIERLRTAGMYPMAFEVVPKSIAKAIIQPKTDSTLMVIHIMNRKTGIYIVSGGVVCFTSTIAWGGRTAGTADVGDVSIIAKEVHRIYTYWMSHSIATSAISGIVLVGHDAPQYENVLKGAAVEVGLPVSMANVWNNVFSLDHYIPPISRDDSVDYVVAAGLALD